MQEVEERPTNGQGVLKRIKELYKEAFMFVNEALTLEERGKTDEAALCYEKGLRLVNTAMSLQINGLDHKELANAESLKNKLEKAKIDVEYRLRILKPLATRQVEPSAPPLLRNQSDEILWEDARTLISIEEGVSLFHVDSQRSVSTWSMPCILRVFQLPGEHKDEDEPPAFLQCGDWVYPLHPGKSPALKSFDKTYMFPDINLQPQDAAPSSIGIVFADIVPEKEIKRFERILSCYCDFRTYSPRDKGAEKPPRPPPPYQVNEFKELNQPEDSNAELALVPVRHSMASKVPGSKEDESSWSEKASNGILIGAKWVSWGLSKGAEISSHYVEKGATKLREKMQPNAEPAKIDPEVSKNVQQIKEVTGAAVKVSSFLVSTLCTLTVQLGKQLSPVVRSQGAKLIPEKYKNGDENGQKTMDDFVKVAAAGIRGFSAVFTSLEESGKVLYKSITKATVDTVNHKYGDDAGDLTGEAMAAAGNTAQAYWNVKKLGAKAITKRAAKDTSKAVLMDEEEKVRSKGNNAIEYK